MSESHNRYHLKRVTLTPLSLEEVGVSKISKAGLVNATALPTAYTDSALPLGE